MKTKNVNNLTLIIALERLLLLAEEKLKSAINKNKEWDIEHYTNDVKFIKNEISIVNQNLTTKNNLKPGKHENSTKQQKTI